jgi:hypothetical protein
MGLSGALEARTCTGAARNRLPAKPEDQQRPGGPVKLLVQDSPPDLGLGHLERGDLLLAVLLLAAGPTMAMWPMR